MGTSWESASDEMIEYLRQCPQDGWLVVAAKEDPKLSEIMALIDRQPQPMMMVCLPENEWTALRTLMPRVTLPVLPMQVKKLTELLLKIKE